MLKQKFNTIGKINRVGIFALFITILLILSLGIREIFLNRSRMPIGEEDYLVYVINHYSGGVYGGSQAMLYDPVRDIHTPILEGWDIGDIHISSNNTLAFSSPHRGKSDIYLVDYPFANSSPRRISYDATFTEPPFTSVLWSQDGQYLAYTLATGEGYTLFVWDGTQSLAISGSPSPPRISGIIWSADNRLAFTELYDEGDPSEVFVWEGDSTMNVSQNPSGEDLTPAWGPEGQLAFLSKRNNEYDIFVWDGVAKKNNLPDVDTFTNVAPELTHYFSNPTWSQQSGLLTFGAPSWEDSGHAQIYAWDGRTVTNISQNPNFHNGTPRWRHDGYWAFSTYFSGQLLYVRDEKNQTKWITEGSYPAWSASGYLLFCQLHSPSLGGWPLAMWDGEKVIPITQGSGIIAIWSNGEGVACMS